MAERKYTHGLQLTRDRNVTIVDIGDMEIWDGADLSLVRDTLNRLVSIQGRRAVAVEMQNVQYVPSGFFGMLYDWFEAGIEVRLYHPRERVRNMLWFRKFFKLIDSGVYRLFEGNGVDEEAAEELWPIDIQRVSDEALAAMTW
ncbi:MAG: hypothetical protein KDA58_00745 [Planctomycetaceae bacterium]|nr:hypothetical protein [Planctomycetaceae bacterium]